MDSVLDQYVAVDAQIQHGKPCFRGTRIPLYAVLELLEAGVTTEAIAGPEYYPELTPAHVRAALHFAAQQARFQEYLPLPPHEISH